MVYLRRQCSVTSRQRAEHKRVFLAWFELVHELETSQFAWKFDRLWSRIAVLNKQ
jgi:hypothetical protein